MKDLGRPISYLVLERGAPVHSSDGEELGRVGEVRADADADIFDSLVVEHGMLARDRRVVPGDQVDEIFERGVLLKLDASAFGSLPEAG